MPRVSQKKGPEKRDTAKIVSFEDEPLILVDGDDQVIGYDTKAACHDGDGKLHRAFSVFLFNPRGELLLQQRAAGKRLWPGIWANSCCSHPRKGEETLDAAHRRVREELNAESSVRFLFKFEYHARWQDLGSEHELCHVFAGPWQGEVQVNPTEIAATRWISPDDLDRELRERPAPYSPWLQLEWPRIRRDHGAELAALRA